MQAEDYHKHDGAPSNRPRSSLEDSRAIARKGFQSADQFS
jgi:hypothetical protein